MTETPKVNVIFYNTQEEEWGDFVYVCDIDTSSSSSFIPNHLVVPLGLIEVSPPIIRPFLVNGEYIESKRFFCRIKIISENNAKSKPIDVFFQTYGGIRQPIIGFDLIKDYKDLFSTLIFENPMLFVDLEQQQGKKKKENKKEKSFKGTLSKIGKKLLPAIVGTIAGIAITPFVGLIAALITSLFSKNKLSLDESLVEDITKELLTTTSKKGAEVTLEVILENIQKKENKTVDINAIIKVLSPLYKELIKVTEFIQKSPIESIIIELKETLKNVKELTPELTKSINDSISTFEKKTLTNQKDIKNKISEHFIYSQNKLNDLSSKLEEIFIGIKEEELSRESALALCSNQVYLEPIKSLNDIEFDSSKYVRRIEAEETLLNFIKDVREEIQISSNNFVLLANMGIGKTWLLGYIIKEIQKKNVPVLFFGLENKNLDKLKIIFGDIPARTSYNLVIKIANATNEPVVIVLDGFEGLTKENQKTILTWAIESVKVVGFNKAAFIISSRIDDWTHNDDLYDYVNHKNDRFYNFNHEKGSLHLVKFSIEVVKEYIAEKYEIENDILENKNILELARYPFIARIFHNYKSVHRLDRLPDPSELNDFMPLFYEDQNDNTILSRMGIRKNVKPFLKKIFVCCRSKELKLNMNCVDRKNLISSKYYNLIFSSGLFCRRIIEKEWEVEAKVNPLFLPYVNILINDVLKLEISKSRKIKGEKGQKPYFCPICHRNHKWGDIYKKHSKYSTIEYDLSKFLSLIIIHREKGVVLFVKSFDKKFEMENELTSGLMSVLYSLANFRNSAESSILIELEMGDFLSFMSFGVYVRVVLILNAKPTNKLDKPLNKIIELFEGQYNDVLKNWKGETGIFNDTEKIIDKVFNVSVWQQKYSIQKPEEKTDFDIGYINSTIAELLGGSTIDEASLDNLSHVFNKEILKKDKNLLLDILFEARGIKRDKAGRIEWVKDKLDLGKKNSIVEKNQERFTVRIYDSFDEIKEVLRHLLKNYNILYYSEIINNLKDPKTNQMVSRLIDKLKELNDPQTEYFKDQNGGIKHRTIISNYHNSSIQVFKNKIKQKLIENKQKSRPIQNLSGDLALIFYDHYEDSLIKENNYLKEIRGEFIVEIGKYPFIKENYNSQRFSIALNILEKDFRLIELFGPEWQDGESSTLWSITNFQNLEDFVKKKSINYILRQLIE